MWTTAKTPRMVGIMRCRVCKPKPDRRLTTTPAKEIESLKKEAEDLRLILAARGSEDFPRKVFEKVFHDDVKRLQSMEDAWKNRQAPMALSFDGLSKDSTGISPSVSAKNQQIWSLEENFVVFSHRCVVSLFFSPF